jgi:hypothetical protein
MENGKQGAFASMNEFERQEGLTKREYFAGLAMIGLYSMKDAICWTEEDIAKMAVKQSDALLAELEKTEKP